MKSNLGAPALEFICCTKMTKNRAAIIAIQGIITGEKLSSGMAFVVFTQSLLPAVFLTLYNLIFVESLSTQVSQHTPDVNPMAIINADATGLRLIVEASDLAGVLAAYTTGVRTCMPGQEISIAQEIQGNGLGLKMMQTLDLIATKVGRYKCILSSDSSTEKFHIKCRYRDSGIEMSRYFEEVKDSTIATKWMGIQSTPP
ncbi:hypothetical protein NUW58_g2867 [Xylaria curta]|uniref:Uncharacterized protein n=1 Tax=Xylaria curta TaxID=42375 RepID=A0ACC1PEI7_9PEZI|nr:hypothetical protein NUW58_g2867 [Xylaria curta]